MIGVICKIDQVAVVEEFFELFKTPWEFYQRGRAYEVVVATADDVPGVDARLLILYGAETKTTDRNAGIRASQAALEQRQGIRRPLEVQVAHAQVEERERVLGLLGLLQAQQPQIALQLAAAQGRVLIAGVLDDSRRRRKP